ncbi:MAG: Ig-like domain-containing protein [Gemmatimonadota bacterium]|nr:Ig-like domain-containing protein [Gemmatimonadota bacterium]
MATSLTVAPSSHTLASIGATVQLSATVRDQNNNPMTGQTVSWTSSNTAVATVSGNGLVTAVSNGMADVMAASGDVSDMVSITVMDPDAVEEGDDGEEVVDVEYIPWVGVRVAPGRLIFSAPGFGALPLTDCFTKNSLIAIVAPFPPEGLKDWDAPTGDTLTVHYSVWQTRPDMESPWTEIEGTRVMYDACPYDPDVAGEYRLVGDVTINDDRSFRRSENTFTVDP